MRAIAAYGRAQKETASKERTLVLLFEAAARHIRQGAQALEAGDYVGGGKRLIQASEIVTELLATLNPTAAPELCQTLAQLYEFVIQRLSRAIAQQSAAFAWEAERALAPVVEAFSQAVGGAERPEPGAGAQR